MNVVHHMPLSDREVDQLLKIVENRADHLGRNLLAYTGADSATGLLTRVAAADQRERTLLIAIIRRAIAAAQV